MQLVLKSVAPNPREWQGSFGPGASVKMWFVSGEQGEYSTKPEKAQQHIDALTALVGKPGEYEVEQRPDFDGVPQLRVKNYPGKVQPAGGFGGKGGGGFQQAWRNGEDGFRFEQDQMMIRTSLMQATQFCGDKALATDITATADVFLNWLRKASGSPANGQKVSEPQTRVSGAIRGDRGSIGALWEGPGQCVSCHCPPGARHGSKCTWADDSAEDPFSGDR